MTKEWVEKYFQTIDSLDPDALIAYYGPNATFRFANQDAWVGHDALRAGLEKFYGSIQAMHHEEQGVWIAPDGNSAVFEAYAHFTLPDGREVVLPAVSVLRAENDVIQDFRFVMDAAPLTAPAK